MNDLKEKSTRICSLDLFRLICTHSLHIGFAAIDKEVAYYYEGLILGKGDVFCHRGAGMLSSFGVD